MKRIELTNKLKHALAYAVALLIGISSCTKNGPTEKRVNRYGLNASIEEPASVRLRHKNLSETDNDLHVGCEALDRGYGDYEAYKAYLNPLGMRYIRLQAGWARCEKEEGVYDFVWLDSIIDDALARGLKPWLQLSYGNPLYKGGGNAWSSSELPKSSEALAAWDKWVQATAEHYNGRVDVWEIWNEPDLKIAEGKNTVAQLVNLSVRTAELLRQVNPQAEIAALALAKADMTLVQEFFSGVKKAGKLDLFDWISYHAYSYIPEQSQAEAERLRGAVAAFSKDIRLWHGESGAPSKGHLGGALSDYEWSEISQAKWALRNMIGDKARGIRTGIYTIAENNYSSGKNTKGLLETNALNMVTRAKPAYYAARNLVSVNNLLHTPEDASIIRVCSEQNIVKYLFSDANGKFRSAVICAGGEIPDDEEDFGRVSVSVTGFSFKDPVAIDLRTGLIFPLEHYESENFQSLYRVPFYDSPVLITEASALE